MFELLTGKEWNPDDAQANEKLFNDAKVSPSVRDVIRKALTAKPEERYQSALEMETALRYLPYQDARFIGYVRHGFAVSILCAFLLALGGFYYVTGLSQLNCALKMDENAAKASESLRDGDYTNALRRALEATDRGSLDPPVTAKAQSALAEILGVYDYIPGYKPLRSVKFSGKPHQAMFSPDGNWIAVLMNNNRIQIFDTEGSRKPLEVQSNENCSFLFLNFDTLLYTGKDGLTSYDLKNKTTSVWDDAPSSDAQTGLALSADGKVVAYVLWETRTAYIFNAQTRKLTRTLTLPELSGNPDPLQRPMKHMATLDATGRTLAVSLPEGRIGLFPTDGSEPDILREASQYRDFEGGFFDHFFFYTASNAWIQGESETFLQTECRLIDLDTGDAVLELHEPTLIHAQADENGIYLSIGNELYRVDPDNQTWDFLVDVENPILLLRHAAGRLLVVTSTQLALVYRDDGAWRVEIARGQNYSISGLSKNYLFLAVPDKALLSVLEWTEDAEKWSVETQKGVILSYDQSDEETASPYLGAHLYADGKTVLLFNAQGFRIYDVETGELQKKESLRDAASVRYHRNKVDDGDPEEEFLKAAYEDSVEFYSAKTGELLQSRDRKNEDDTLTFRAGGWLAQQTGDDTIEISYGGKSKKMGGVDLIYASETNGKLILSLKTGENQYSVILDKQLEEIANLPESCEATPDGMLLFDDRQGNLHMGTLRSVEDLRALANQKLEAEVK